VRLSEQRGKAVLLDFWASWCRPCREQAKVIERVRAKNPDLLVIGINVSDTPEAAARYLAAENPPWLVVQDVEGAADRAYDVETLPTVVVIDGKGSIVAVRRRFVPDKELGAMLAEITE
jgi:thiol-disulfide isomerase/thioredoxin